VAPVRAWARILRSAAVGVAAWASVVQAAGQFIEDIQVSRSGDAATIRLELACPMRFQSDFATVEGVLLEIRVVPLESCRQLGAQAGASEVYRPVGGHLAHLLDVEYESLGVGENLLMLKFDRPVEYRVTQGGDLRSLELRVRAAGEPSIAPAESPRPARAPVREASPARQLPVDRAPLVPRVRAPVTLADYVINLQSTREPAEPTLIASILAPSAQRLYVSETEVDGARWHRLRLGFFSTEAEARAALAPLLERFPHAWVGRVEPEEVRLAAELAATGGVVREAARERVPANPSVGAGETLTAEQVVALLAEGREALLASELDRAIRTYARLLAAPGEHGAQAREYLGLARERNGQPAYARAEYQQYLRDYPEGEGAARVRQRLTGLVTAAEPPRETLASASREPRWDVSTGVSQYYRRVVDRFDEELPEIVSLSALFSDADFSVRHSGTTVGLLGRITVNHLRDLIGDDAGGPGDRSRISYAYIDLDGTQRAWSLRVGRQTLRSSGVLGRFDGGHAAYEWADGRRLHLVTGYPVESTRDSIETDRQFHGIAVDFDDLIGAWDMSTFVNQQTIEGINDRQAVGLEVRYADERRSLTSMLDYDVGYSELNTALALGTWRLPNRMTLSALVDVRAGPVLTTRNALIGQPVATIEELLSVWTEEEIREIARDRTAASRTATLGIAKPVGERFQVNADVTLTEIGETVDSFGVAAVPSTGPQTYYSGSFVGAGLFGSGDVMIFNLRYGDSDEFTLRQLTWEARFPIGRHLRINPRLQLATWDSPMTGRSRETVIPSFRLLLNPAKRYRLELEVGSNRFVRWDRASEQKSSGHFLNLGYRADF
jgi:hypothetical protein